MSTETRYHVGKTQNQPEHIPTFLQRNTGDPAVKVGLFSCVIEISLIIVFV
jgi:hypothetical protein